MRPTGALAWVLAGALACWTGAAFAQTCSFTPSVNFGTIDPSTPSNTTVMGIGTISCSGFGTPYISVCANLNGDTAPRYMVGPSSAKLRFEMYRDPGGSMQWGSSWTGNYPLDRQMATSGGAASGDKMFYGVVFGNQTGLPAGTYTVTITGGKLQNYAYSGSPPTCSTSGQASSTSFQLVVSATIAASCTVSSSNVDFGQRGIITQSATTTALVTTSCPSGTNYQIGLNAGTGVGATMSERRMTRSGGSDTLTYRLYRDSGRTQVWGDGTGGSTTVSTTGTGAPQTNTIYAELPVQSAPVGSYADTVTVTVTF